MHEALNKRTEISRSNLRVRRNGRVLMFDIEIVPFLSHRSDDLYLLIAFVERGPAGVKARRHGSLVSRVGSWFADRLDLVAARQTREELELEMASLREYVQTLMEEHEAANEKLQSTNEELLTLNAELQDRNAVIERANDDLTNLLASADPPIVMLGRDLRIRRFTPRAEDFFNLIPADVGRPITDINILPGIEDLRGFLLDALDRLQVRTVETRDNEGHEVTLSIHPYRTSDDRIEGVVLVGVVDAAPSDT